MAIFNGRALDTANKQIAFCSPTQRLANLRRGSRLFGIDPQGRRQASIKRCRHAVRKLKEVTFEKPGDIVQIDTLSIYPLPGVTINRVFTVARDAEPIANILLSCRGMPSMDLKLVALALSAGCALLSLSAPSSALARSSDTICSSQASVPGPNAISFVPIYGGNQTYCQSAFGWSDEWLPTEQPSFYDQEKDVLSGDNAPGVFYTTAAGTVGSGNNYNRISPWLDAGILNANYIGSDWQVVSDIAVSGNVGKSKITLDGLDLAITTTVLSKGVTEQFSFTNNTDANITDLFFDDYFNFHPNGSLGNGYQCAITSTNGATVTSVAGKGGGCPLIVADGTMEGSGTPFRWGLEFPATLLAEIANGTYNNALGPRVGDTAVDLAWELGALDVGQTTDFTIFKNFSPVPEPATWAMMLVGLTSVGAAARIQRRRRPSSANA